MDTISRENNSMLPVGGIIVGVIGLLLGGFAAIKVSSLSKIVTEQHQPKIDKIDGIESQAASAASAAERTSKDLKSLKDSTQEAFNTVGPALADLRTSITKIEEAQKKPAAVTKKGGEPVTAGPGEYVVKSGDTGAKIARANGVTLADLQAVNPGVDWTKVHIGQKVKLPSNAKK
jgi:LysM repeat protein